MVNHKPASNRIPSIAGQRFGRLVALHEVEKNKHGVRRWVCHCDCGSPDRAYLQDLLRQGLTKSCGCLHKEVTRAMLTRHGATGGGERSPEHTAWHNMRSRCYRTKTHNYANYGGRGITVCARWRGRDGFANFLADVGPRPSPRHSLDRYPNTNGNYEPGNVRWATARQQAQNRRDTLLVDVGGRSVPLIALTRRLGVSYWATYARLKRGAALRAALGLPEGQAFPHLSEES